MIGHWIYKEYDLSCTEHQRVVSKPCKAMSMSCQCHVNVMSMSCQRHVNVKSQTGKSYLAYDVLTICIVWRGQSRRWWDGCVEWQWRIRKKSVWSVWTEENVWRNDMKLFGRQSEWAIFRDVWRDFILGKDLTLIAECERNGRFHKWWWWWWWMNEKSK